MKLCDGRVPIGTPKAFNDTGGDKVFLDFQGFRSVFTKQPCQSQSCTKNRNLRSLAGLQKQLPFRLFQKPVREAEFSVGCGPIQHNMGDANAVLFGERHQRIGVFSVYIEY